MVRRRKMKRKTCHCTPNVSRCAVAQALTSLKRAGLLLVPDGSNVTPLASLTTHLLRVWFQPVKIGQGTSFTHMHLAPCRMWDQFPPLTRPVAHTKAGRWWGQA